MRYLTLLLFTLNTLFNYGQLTITNGSAPSILVDSLVGSGVSFSNVNFSGVYGGTKYQAGLFNTSGTVSANLGFNSGIVLCTGKTSDIPLALGTYPGNSNFSSTGLTSCTSGEIRESGTCASAVNDVDILAGSERYYNSAILEFDFILTGTAIEFQYVFGSEEYDQDDGAFSINYNCSSYNDKFGFIISGPGISGGQGYDNDGENIARLSNGSEVAINSVNNGVVGSYGGAPSASNCISANPSWSNGFSTAEFNGAIYGIQFNGNTKVLTATKTGLTSGATYHIKLIVTDVKDGAYDSGVFLKAGSFSPPVALPIELFSFESKCIVGKANLLWTTLSEINNDYFVIEKSLDARIFSSIGELDGNGNTNSMINYSFIDEEEVDQTTYYRLKQVDFNGDYSYSNVIVVNPCTDNGIEINGAYYNESTNEILIDYSSIKESNINLKVFDLQGRIVIEKELILTPSENKLKVKTSSSISSGLYLVNVVSDKKNMSFKVLISK